MKVYAIDVDEADEVNTFFLSLLYLFCRVLMLSPLTVIILSCFMESLQLDDALSATRLDDGRIKIWIHVADPARYVSPGSKVDR